MASKKETAQKAYDDAYAKHQEAYEELVQRRADLDEILREEEAERHAVYLGFEEGDETGVAAAKALMARRREEKEVLRSRALTNGVAERSSAGEQIGGLS